MIERKKVVWKDVLGTRDEVAKEISVLKEDELGCDWTSEVVLEEMSKVNG